MASSGAGVVVGCWYPAVLMSLLLPTLRLGSAFLRECVPPAPLLGGSLSSPKAALSPVLHPRWAGLLVRVWGAGAVPPLRTCLPIGQLNSSGTPGKGPGRWGLISHEKYLHFPLFPGALMASHPGPGFRTCPLSVALCHLQGDHRSPGRSCPLVDPALHLECSPKTAAGLKGYCCSVYRPESRGRDASSGKWCFLNQCG